MHLGHFRMNRKHQVTGDGRKESKLATATGGLLFWFVRMIRRINFIDAISLGTAISRDTI